MNKNVKFILIFFVILCIILGIYFCSTKLLDTNKSTSTSAISNMSDNTSMEVVENINNVVENEVQNTVIEQNEVVDEQNKKEEPIEDNQTSSKTELSANNESEVESIDDEQKAIEIVKKDWGITDGVIYTCESINSNGNYVISVREATTRNAMAWYTVNPKTGEFSN